MKTSRLTELSLWLPVPLCCLINQIQEVSPSYWWLAICFAAVGFNLVSLHRRIAALEAREPAKATHDAIGQRA